LPIEDRFSEMTDKELQNLHDNAVRLAAGPASKRQAEAERLLPLVAQAMEDRQKTRQSELADRKAARVQVLADARAKRAAEKAEQKAEKKAKPAAEE
jgi:hypothetical protein